MFTLVLSGRDNRAAIASLWSGPGRPDGLSQLQEVGFNGSGFLMSSPSLAALKPSASIPVNILTAHLEFQKLLHLLQCLVQRQMKGAAAWPWTGKAELVLQPAIDHL